MKRDFVDWYFEFQLVFGLAPGTQTGRNGLNREFEFGEFEGAGLGGTTKETCISDSRREAVNFQSDRSAPFSGFCPDGSLLPFWP